MTRLTTQKIESLRPMLWRFHQTRNTDRGVEYFETTKENFLFHMTDWYDDLLDISSLFSSPEQYTSDQVKRIINGFLSHAVAHLIEASRIYDRIYDTFGIDCANSDHQKGSGVTNDQCELLEDLGPMQDTEAKMNQLREILERVLFDRNSWRPNYCERTKRRWVTHMLLSSGDLKAMTALYKRPEKYSVGDAHMILERFLTCTVAHLLEACRNYDQIYDIFGAQRGQEGHGFRQAEECE